MHHQNIRLKPGRTTAEGCAPEVIASRILLAGVAETGLTAAGRCSVRTGLCSEGPTPLPIQQV